MKEVETRLRRLEEALRSRSKGPQAQLTGRIAAGRRRLGLPPASSGRLLALRGMSLVEILNAGRERVHAAWRHRQRKVAPETALAVGPNRSAGRWDGAFSQ